jgi:preprotein translocase subunit SecD
VISVIALGGLALVIVAGWGPKLGLDLEGGFSVTLQPVEDVPEDSLDQAIEVIRTRVDSLGVAEPEITRQGETIVVSLPGVTDRDRARELVGQTAELRFRPVAAEPLPGDPEEIAANTTTSTTATDGSTTTTVAGETTTTTTAPEDPLDAFQVTPREDDDPDQPVVLQEVEDGEVVATYQLGPAIATGEIISDASAELNPSTGEWAVALEVTGDGIEAWNEAASRCYSKDETCPTGQLAIVLDSVVVSAPEIQTPSFTRDQISISGSFSEREAKDLARLLRYGSLPVALEVQQTQEVSASLGSGALRAGIVSGIIGLVLVAAYMIAYYRLLGLVAVGSLTVSAALLWVIIAWMGEVRELALTLAGITGIIVSIGVAVDSNVVFYEDFREKVWRGATPRSVALASFNSSFRTIVTANMASLIGAVLLYVLTIGSVRGFALFLAIGTVLDMIASYWFMRPMTLYLARNRRLAAHPRWLGMRVRKEAEG